MSNGAQGQAAGGREPGRNQPAQAGSGLNDKDLQDLVASNDSGARGTARASRPM